MERKRWNSMGLLFNVVETWTVLLQAHIFSEPEVRRDGCTHAYEPRASRGRVEGA